MTDIHDVWSFAKNNHIRCTEGYDKKAFNHVAWWFDEYHKSCSDSAQIEVDKLIQRVKTLEAQLKQEKEHENYNQHYSDRRA